MGTEFIKFEDTDKIVRDKKTKAVLITDGSALKTHLKNRHQSTLIESMDNRINSLEEKMDLILNILQKSKP